MAGNGAESSSLEKASLIEADQVHEETLDDDIRDETQITLLDCSNVSEKDARTGPPCDGQDKDAFPSSDWKDISAPDGEDEGDDDSACLVKADENKKDKEEGVKESTETQQAESKTNSDSSEPVKETSTGLQSQTDGDNDSTNSPTRDAPRKPDARVTFKTKKGGPKGLLIKDKKKKAMEIPRAKKEKSFSLTSSSLLLPRTLSDRGDRKPKQITVAVFVKDGDAKLIVLDNGKHTTAGEIKQMMIDNLVLPPIASTIFAIWLTSPLLELQLKDHHIPFNLRKEWPDLLGKFAMVNDDFAIENDEPVLVFQRNTFLSLEVEKKINNQKILQILYEEAKCNVLQGKYPVANCDGEMLGGFVARLENGKYDPENHKIGFFKHALPNYLPPTCRGKWFTRSVSVEQKLLDQFIKASDRCDDPNKLHRLFLEQCWTLPFYGCTFFKGKVEHESRLNDYMPWKTNLVNVYIGINRQGITIFKENRREILLTLNYDDLSWDVVPSKEAGVLDSFCIEFDTTDEDGRRLAKQLEIFSSQAVMMDAMVDSCVTEMNRLKIPKTPTTPEDGSRSLADEGPPFLKRNRKSNFSLSSPFKLPNLSSH